ncbi:MAG TPA: bleomycin resistance protein [Devosia sp.]|nr:bleomycin resistance protein [Devosia sp.]
MTDRATPNLPSRDFAVTSEFYCKLGFGETWRDPGWLIMKRGNLALEFFLFPELRPAESAFSACLRLDDLDEFYRHCLAAKIPESAIGWPRLHAPKIEAWGGRIGALIDPDCSLLRLIQN